MNLYNVEIFKPDYSFRDSAQIQEVSFEFDYLSLTKNKIKLQSISAAEGDFIRFSKGTRKIVGIIKGVSDSDTVTIEYISILSLFDVKVYADVMSVNEGETFEDWIAEILETLYVNNDDNLQNIEGMTIHVTSQTPKKTLGYDSNIFNLYEFLTKVLIQYDVVVDVDINIKEKVLNVTIGKRNENEKHIEADLPNVFDKEIAYEKGSESVNKITLVNEDKQNEKISYYLLEDGTVSDAVNDSKRISPVIFDTMFISVDEDEVFEDKAYDEAIAELVPAEYDNYISITVNEDDSLVKPNEWLIGQRAAIIHKGHVYHTILTGIKIGKRTELIFGSVRKELTKKLKRRKMNGYY